MVVPHAEPQISMMALAAPAAGSSTTARFCIGCNDRFTGAACRHFHPDYMYDDEKKTEPPAAAAAGNGGGAVAVSALQLKQEGSLAFRAGDFEGAASKFSAAAVLEPAERSHPSNLSLALLRKGATAAALASAERCVELAPTWGKAHYRRGCAQRELGMMVDARAAFQLAESFEPDNKEVSVALAQMDALISPSASRDATADGDAETPHKSSMASLARFSRVADADKVQPVAAATAAAAPQVAAAPQQLEPALQPEPERITSVPTDPAGEHHFEPCPGELTSKEALPYLGFPVGVAVSPGRRRCMVARRALSVGEVAWQCKPWAAVSSDAFVSSVCSFCYRPATKQAVAGTAHSEHSLRCNQCELYCYCSEQCQAAAAPLHALECRPAWEVVRMTRGRDSTATRLLVRMLAQRRLEAQRSAAAAAVCAAAQPELQEGGLMWRGTTFEGHVQHLQSHLDDLPPARLAGMRGIAKGLASVPGLCDETLANAKKGGRVLSEDGILQLLGAVQCNSQGIVDLQHHIRLQLNAGDSDAHPNRNGSRSAGKSTLQEHTALSLTGRLSSTCARACLLLEVSTTQVPRTARRVLVRT